MNLITTLRGVPLGGYDYIHLQWPRLRIGGCSSLHRWRERCLCSGQLWAFRGGNSVLPTMIRDARLMKLRVL